MSTQVAMLLGVTLYLGWCAFSWRRFKTPGDALFHLWEKKPDVAPRKTRKEPLKNTEAIPAK